MTPAVFLDRDGVLIEDVHLLTRADQLRVMPGVARALTLLDAAGFKLVVVSNQPVVARGLCSEDDVRGVNAALATLLRQAGAPGITGWFVCPHHPNATLPEYRVDCECRKPRPGLLIRAARELQLDLGRSYAVGDRLSDIAAGNRAGCRTVLVTTGRHTEAPIQSPDSTGFRLDPDWTCANLEAAAEWILRQR